MLNGVSKMASFLVDVFGEGSVTEMAPELEMENGREIKKKREIRERKREKIGK